MATVDAVMADKRAADVIAKYRDRFTDMSLDEHDRPSPAAQSLLHEMQQDIANAINAAIAEALAREPAEEKQNNGEFGPADRLRSRNTTHMPATGHDKPAARK